ncbi:MAG: PEP-CTERM sorting domain-containing protein [Rhodospirillaceae bacterium]
MAVGALGAAFTATASAEAATINFASFGVGGAFNLPAGSHLGNTNSIFIGNGGNIFVTQGDIGDLDHLINFGDLGKLKDIPSLSSFTPIGGYLTLNSGVTVDLNTLNIGDRGGPTPGFIDLYGNATVHAPGFDATEAKYSFSGTTSDNVGFVLAMHTSVPEPLPVALLGLGLVGLFVSRRYTARTNVAAAA